jgi:hypothetical protein
MHLESTNKNYNLTPWSTNTRKHSQNKKIKKNTHYSGSQFITQKVIFPSLEQCYPPFPTTVFKLWRDPKF